MLESLTGRNPLVFKTKASAGSRHIDRIESRTEDRCDAGGCLGRERKVVAIAQIKILAQEGAARECTICLRSTDQSLRMMTAAPVGFSRRAQNPPSLDGGGLYAGHVRQLRGGSPPTNLVEVKV